MSKNKGLDSCGMTRWTHIVCSHTHTNYPLKLSIQFVIPEESGHRKLSNSHNK
ncbi:hypothetical protein [Chryseobacterium arthrosphaerae]|uniref:hypothetical protein n=1 Tax=Chryseobacterium arthrosphaerae TaxID=651561 RepID=UPI0028AB5557|nr:hypothetical protein [Chryseobacterium arthrosphaerae]